MGTLNRFRWGLLAAMLLGSIAAALIVTNTTDIAVPGLGWHLRVALSVSWWLRFLGHVGDGLLRWLGGTLAAIAGYLRRQGWDSGLAENQATDAVNYLLQVALLGAGFSMVAAVVRRRDLRERQAALGEQIRSDYMAILWALLHLRKDFPGARVRRGQGGLAHKLNTLERRIERLEDRSSQFDGLVGPGALRHFEHAAALLGNLHDFIGFVRRWSEDNRGGPDGGVFKIPNQDASADWPDRELTEAMVLGEEKEEGRPVGDRLPGNRRIDLFAQLDADVMAVLRALHSLPDPDEASRLSVCWHALRKVQSDFLYAVEPAQS